jgi:cobalt-zinc-cadmium efflux system protein
MVITGSMMFVELVGGIFANSLALVSDAGHMFTHFFALALSYFAMRIATRPVRDERTFGHYRAEILAALVNGLVLLGVTAYIIYEAVLRVLEPEQIADTEMLVIAIAGLVVNLISALLLAGAGKRDLNVRSAFLHMVGDTLSSVAVVAGAVLIGLTGHLWIDPVISGLIALMIGLWSIRLLRDSSHVLLESTPKHVRIAELTEGVRREFPEIGGLHDVHVWEITSGMYAMSAHVSVPPERTVREIDTLRARLERFLKESLRIGHTSLQFEGVGACCGGAHGEGKCCESRDDAAP